MGSAKQRGLRHAWSQLRQAGGGAVSQLYWRPRAGRRPGALAILHTGRCGSNAFGHLLHQHDRVLYDGEPFERTNLGTIRRRIQGIDPEPSLANLPRLMRFAGDRWYVGSFLVGQTRAIVSPAELPGRLVAAGYDRFVVLRRRNLLRVLVSRYVARERGAFHEAVNDPSRSRNAVALPLRLHDGLTLRERLSEFEDFYTSIEAAIADGGWPTLSLCFEDEIQSDPRVAYERICEFLEIPPTSAEIKLRRTGDAPLEQLVANLEEVRSHLAATPFAWMAA